MDKGFFIVPIDVIGKGEIISCTCAICCKKKNSCIFFNMGYQNNIRNQAENWLICDECSKDLDAIEAIFTIQKL